jgi:hypothetical protein
MSVSTVRHCDYCGGAEVQNDADRWRILEAKDGTPAQDVCPVCVARMRRGSDAERVRFYGAANAGLVPLGRRVVEVDGPDNVKRRMQKVYGI